MIVLETVAIGLILIASQTCADICTGQKDGQHLPHLTDCSMFYVCNFGESKLFECPAELLYDHSKRACNWANAVNCDRTGDADGTTILSSIGVPITSPSAVPTTAAPQTEVPTTAAPQTEVPTTAAPQTEVPITDSPQTLAPTTVSTQSPINETTSVPFKPSIPTTYPPQVIVTPVHPEYNKSDVVYPGLIEIRPNIFHCMDAEFYFAPHPRNCEMYFICENYRIHPHECGEGVHWDYVNHRCDYPIAALCYANPQAASFGKMVCTAGGHTTEYKHDECKYKASSVIVPITDKTCASGQTFVAHEVDCRKYYICIEQMPIATSCPENTAWDRNSSQCNEESYKQCIG